MTAKKKNPLEKYKTKDLEELRTILWEIVRNGVNETARVNAAKTLARLHKSLQPEKIQEKKKKPEKQKLSAEDEKEIEKQLDEILGEKS